jgi:ribulose bisphosphate carboxylase small subunit
MRKSTIKFYFFSVICASIFNVFSTSAQDLAFANNAKNSKTYNTPVTPEQARTQIVSFLNQFSTENEVVDKFNFNAYMAKMTQLFKNKIRAIETDDVKDAFQMEAKSEYIRALNILKSAQCLAETKQGQFVKQKDYESQEIVAFNLDELRQNARYGLVENFREGFARFKKDQVYGFMNYCGEEIITNQYEASEPFNDGKALVKKVDWFFIDAAGQESEMLQNVVEAQAIKHGISIAKLKDGKYALIDNRYDVTKSLSSEKYDDIKPFIGMDVFRVRKGDKFGLMTLKGDVKLEPIYETIEPMNAPNLYKITQNGKIGLMNSEWQIKFQPSFTELGDFDMNGLAMAKEGNGYRLISNRTFRSSALYKSIGSFNSLKIAQIESVTGHFGLIDNEMNVIVEPQYASIGEFNELGLAEVCKAERKCGYITDKGLEIISPVYEEVGKFNKFGVVVVRELTKDCNKNKNCKTDLVYNKFGQIVIAKANEKEVNTMKIRYEIVDSLHSKKFIIVKMFLDDEIQGYHLIESSTYRLITSMVYQSISPADVNGVFRVKKNNLWGMIDITGAILFEPTYLDIRKSNDGYYPALNKDEKIGFIDKKGKFLIPFEYDDVKYFRNGHCVVTKGKEKWGLINKYNAKVIPLYFKTVTFKEGHYEMTDDKGNTFMIDDKGDCMGANCAKFEEIRKKANH